jgi:ankyrin repeat protein
MRLPSKEENLIAHAHNGSHRKVRDLLRESVNVNAVGDDGYTALMAASQNGYVKVVKELLLYSNVNVDIRRVDC